MARVYIAAPLSQAEKCEALAKILYERGHVPVSTWHVDVVRFGITSDVTEPVARRRALDRNLADLDSADVVFAVTVEGHPRTTYFEIGRACALSKPVVWVTGEREALCDAHEMVHVAASADDAFKWIDWVESQINPRGAA